MKHLKSKLSAKLFATLASLAVGSAVVAYSFHVASTGSQPLMFALFWVGMLIATLPLIVNLASSKASTPERVFSIVGLALMTTLPKVLRSPFEPLFHDEYAHLRATEDILTTGFTNGYNSIVTPVPQFSGLHALTAWVSSATGLNAWTSGLAVISVAHVAGLIGVYVLIRALGLSSRGAAIGAAVYATNANWMYFHSQFGYESLGLPLVLWTLILAIYAIRAASPKRYIFLLAIAPVSYALATIHHLSSLSMLSIIILIALFLTVTNIKNKSYSQSIMAWSVVIVSGTFIYIKLIPTIGLLVDYLGSPVSRSTKNLFAKLAELLGISEEGGNTRVLFQGGNLPAYERILSFAATLSVGLAVAFVIYVWLSRLWNKLPKFKTFNIPVGSPIRNAILSLSLMYIISVPFILSASGAESARRSWGYSFIGVAVVFALIADMVANRTVDKHQAAKDNKNITIAFSSLFIVLLIGGVAAGVNESYRFPVPSIKVNDITASTAEAKELGLWLKANAEENTWVLADRYSGMQAASVGRTLVAPPSKAFSYWEFYYKTSAPEVSMVAQMRAINVQYMIVDKRILTESPEMGFWFETGEPRNPNGIAKPFVESPDAFKKFDHLPWLSKVFSTQNYSIYKFNLDLYNPYQTEQIIEELYK